MKGGGPATVPSAPFVDWLVWKTGQFDEITAAGRHLQLDESHIRRLLAGRQTYISLALVDRVFVAAGDPGLLYRLYPLAEDELGPDAVFDDAPTLVGSFAPDEAWWSRSDAFAALLQDVAA